MSRNPHPTPGFRRLPRVADQMTPTHDALLLRSIAAERAGRVAEALELHRRIGPFRERSRHRQMMEQLVEVADPPGWVLARWIGYQAVRCEDRRSETAAIRRRVLGLACETVHADLFEECYEAGGDPVKVIARAFSESWLFQELFLFDAGGLGSFLSEHVDAPLRERAAVADGWTDAPMGGYRIGASLPGSRLRVYDASTATWRETLDLGARAVTEDGPWVLGRLVPSGVDDLPMFDRPPLWVPTSVARDVARAPEEWTAVVAEAIHDGRLDRRDLLREDYELVTDVEQLELVRIGTPPRELARVMRQLRSGRDEVSRAAFRILRAALLGELPEEDAAYVAAAALLPRAAAEVRRRLPGHREACLRWASQVPEPGRTRLLELAEATRAAG